MNAGSTSVEPSADQNAGPLLGTWRLRSFEMHDQAEQITYPFSREPIGFITYTADGRMSVQFGSSLRSDLKYDDWLGATAAEIDGAARAYFAYCGTFEVRGSEVIHRIEASLMPNWIGGEQLRYWTLDGDTLTIKTPPLRLEGHPQVSILVWERL